MKCPSCKAPKVGRQYLCRGCWFTLVPAARRALNRSDDQALTRLRQLLDQIRDGVPLHQIEVSP